MFYYNNNEQGMQPVCDSDQQVFVCSGIRKNNEGVPEVEENFDEAIKNVNSSLHLTTVSVFIL